MATRRVDSPGLAYVIPAFRAEGTLGATLRSLVGQTRRDWEAVVVDDSSPDDLAGVVARVGDARVRLIRQPNGGPAAARQRGLSESVAPAVCFIDADDLAEPGHAEALLGTLDAHPGATVAAGALRAVTPRGEPLAHRLGVRPDALETERVMQGNPVQLGAAVIRRALLERVIARYGTLMDARCHCEDWEFWMRASACGAALAPPVEREVLRYTRARGTRSRGRLETFESGLGAIRLHAGTAEDEGRWSKLFAVRSLGRAVAGEDAALAAAARRVASAAGPGVDSLLGSAIHGELALDLPDDPGAWSDARGRVTDTIRRFIPDHPAPELLALRATITPSAWVVVADRAAARAASGRTLVLFGLGQNGRRVAARLSESGRRAVFIDDNPDARGPLPRMHEQDLTGEHVVLVTPFERDRILSRLARVRVGEVLLPEHLIEGAAA